MEEFSFNKKVIYILVTILFIFLIMSNCKRFYNIYNENKLKKETTAIGEYNVEHKGSFIQKDDGWYYYINSDKYYDGTLTYINGCNLKYATLDDNYVKYVYLNDKSKNYNVLATPPTLHTSYFKKDGKTATSDELDKINDFLLEKDVNENLEVDDLKELKLVNFDENDILTLWNNLNTSQSVSKYGNYENNECILQYNDTINNHFQVGVFFDYGYIKAVRIDYVYKNDKYLTDLITNKKATSEQNQLYTNIKKIEKEILKSGNFKLDNKFNNLKEDKNYQELFELFEKIENENKE